MSITDTNDPDPVLIQNRSDKLNEAYNPRIVVECVEPYESNENTLVPGLANSESKVRTVLTYESQSLG